MSALSKELVQEIIQENDFKNPGDILSFLMESFRDVLQEMLEAENEEIALNRLEDLKNKWGKDYPYAFKSWESNWDVLWFLFL